MEESSCNCSLNGIDDDLPKKCGRTESTSNTEQRACYKRFIIHFNENHSFLDKYCPLECDTFEYNYLINSRNSQTMESSNSTQISVYYDDLKYTFLSENPKVEFVGLVSNIGGSLGLFLGISFFSFVELFEVLAEFIFIYFE